MDFAAEFQCHYRVLWLVAYSVVRNSADADDAMQEAAIVGLRRRESFTPGSSFRAWMAQIVRNVSLNGRRSTARASRRLDRTAAIERVAAEDKPGPPGWAGAALRPGPAQADLDQEINRALMALSETARTCLLLRSIESLTYDEISAILDIPPGTAMSHVSRARRELALRLASHHAPRKAQDA